jgi:23S rRNA (guanine745-N1)-methyltransferase
MVADRAAFLAAGHYDTIAEAVTTALTSAIPIGAQSKGAAESLLVDAGTGTGFYLARVLEALPEAVGIGLDVSKPALRRAARAHPRAAAVLADLWQPLPLANGSAAVVLDVFAPRNGPEFHRILRPDGVLLVVTPAADHLHELIASHRMLRVDPDKADRVADTLADHFTVEQTSTRRAALTLTGAELRTLIGMTPSARHVSLDVLPLTETNVTAAVDVTTYRRRPA